MQRTKLGLVFLKVVMSFVSCSLYSCPTVRNMPFLVLEALGRELSVILAIWSRPTMRSTAGQGRPEGQTGGSSRFNHWASPTQFKNLRPCPVGSLIEPGLRLPPFPPSQDYAPHTFYSLPSFQRSATNFSEDWFSKAVTLSFRGSMFLVSQALAL